MFPKNFLWGAAEAGFQFEMGDLGRKNIDPNTDWFKWVHDAENIRNKTVSGDLPENGINYWELYKVDHDLARDLGMNAYRLGVEWSRIFPKNTSEVKTDVEIASDGRISKMELDEKSLEKLESLADINALKHYEKMIDDLREKGFKVIICLNHFTLPLWVHDPIAARDSKLKRGPRGWYDQDTVVEFTKYAAFLAWKLGAKIDMWATFNEPNVVAEMGYFMGLGGFPPGIKMNALSSFRAFKRVLLNMIVAHARAFEAIKKFDVQRADSDNSQPASVGIIQNVIPAMPLDPSREADSQASRFLEKMHNAFFIDAASSGWVDINLNNVKDENEVKRDLEGKMDWLGLNYYTRMVVSGKKFFLAKLFVGLSAIPELVEGYGFACKANEVSKDGRPTSDFGWELYPEGLTRVIVEMSRYGRPIYVTENGAADSEDRIRSRYIVEHLRVLENVIEEKQADLRGYFHWALTDNYEWAEGFSMKFGLYNVDLNTKKRLRRKGAEVLGKIIQNGTVSNT
ncbi:MAG: beta-galactosidase BgaS [Thermoproteota archaeon]